MAIPKTQIRELVQGLCGTTTTWDTEPLGFQKGARVILSILSHTDLGIDDEVEDYNATLGSLKVTTHGMRSLVIAARVDSLDPGIEPLDVADHVRTRMIRPTSRATLRAAGLSWRGSESLVTTEWRVDGRKIRSAILDLRFTHSITDVQEDNVGGWIASAEVTGPVDPAP